MVLKQAPRLEPRIDRGSHYEQQSFTQRFRNLGLIETNKDRFLIIKGMKLTDYLAQIASDGGRRPAGSFF